MQPIIYVVSTVIFLDQATTFYHLDNYNLLLPEALLALLPLKLVNKE